MCKDKKTERTNLRKTTVKRRKRKVENKTNKEEKDKKINKYRMKIYE